MSRNARFIALKDIQYLVRGRETFVWLFIMPIAFFYFIGTVTAGFGGASGPERIAVWAPDNSGFLVDQFVRRLEDQEYEVIRPDTIEEFNRFGRRVTIPEDFTSRVVAGEKGVVGFARSQSGLGQDYDNIRVGRALYTVLADLVATDYLDEEPGPAAFERLEEMPRMLSLEVAPAGQRQEIPTGFEQAIPGTMVMFTMIALLTSGAVTLVIERKQGLLRRLASTPIDRGEIVLGKWGGRMALGLVQITFAMLAGTVIFGMDWGPDLLMIVAVLTGWAAVCASLGLLLGNLASSEGQAIGIGVLTANVLAALGGCWWPIEITPGWMQTFQKLLPTGWAMDAMHRLISFQAGPASALPHLAAMFALAAITGWVGARRFRFQ